MSNSENSNNSYSTVWSVKNNVTPSKANQDFVELAGRYMDLRKEYMKQVDAHDSARLTSMQLELDNTTSQQQLENAVRAEQQLAGRVEEHERKLNEILAKLRMTNDEIVGRYTNVTTNLSFANAPPNTNTRNLRTVLGEIFPGTAISNDDLNGFRTGTFSVPNNAPNNTPALKSAKARARTLLRGGKRTRKGGRRRGGGNNNNNNETVWPVNNVSLNELKNQQNRIEYYESLPKIQTYTDLKRKIFKYIQPRGAELVETHKRLLREVAGLEAEFKTTPTIELRNALVAKRKQLREVQADVDEFDIEIKKYSALYNELSRDPDVRNYRRIVTNISFADPSDREIANAIKGVYANIYENDEVPPTTIQSFLNGNYEVPVPANTNTNNLRAKKRRLANLVSAKTRRRKL